MNREGREQTPKTRERFPTNRWPRAFTHPLWWCALAVLLLNDHVWKHGAAVPQVLTGKLSDFAGLLVAPPLLALVFGAARRQTRWLAPLCVGVGFALVKLVPAAAFALEQALAFLGFPAHVCLDSTDLWALSVLPIASRLCTAAPAVTAPLLPGSLRFARRAGLALAAFACIATSGFGSNNVKRSDAPQVENGTSSTLAVIIASTEGAGGCNLYRDDRVSLLTEDAFIAPRTLMLDPGETAALPSNAATTSCGAASIALPDGTATRVFWRDLKEIANFVPGDDPRRAARVLTLAGKPGAFKTELGDDLHALELGGTRPDAKCESVDPEFSLEATTLARSSGFLELGEKRTAQDGCIEVDWFDQEGDSSPDSQRLCIPDWAFPFEMGQTLSVIQELGANGERTLHVAQFSGSVLKLELVIWNEAAKFTGGRVSSLAANDCIGTLTECGAYVRPAVASISGKSTKLNPGGETTIKGTKPKQTHVLIGSARSVSWTGATCTGIEAHAGFSANVLELRTY